jgi:ubiquinone/menaquinone biosynthesis C-methylase UbiE
MESRSIIYFPRKVAGYIWRHIFPPDKYKSELLFWKRLFREQGNRFNNSWYVNIMLPMSGEKSAESFSGKVVADFGCGPQGSLWWVEAASERLGIDVLADKYREVFDLSNQKMKYIGCSETEIPLPDNSVDILFTLNAMDHVRHFDIISRECLRILKPGGLFAGGFNLNEEPTATEPQKLTEDAVNDNILKHLQVKSYRITRKGPTGSHFKYFFENSDLQPGFPDICMLWVYGTKKNSN